MDHTNSRNGDRAIASQPEEVKEKQPAEKASLGDLYKYLDGNWYLLVVVGLTSAFCCGVGAAFVVLVVMQLITDITHDRRHSTLARKYSAI
jgi:hypothetical protein